MISYWSSIITMYLYCTSSEIDYFPKFNDVTWPWPRTFQGQFDP